MSRQAVPPTREALETDNMAADDESAALPFQEALDVVRLPSQGEARRFMGTRAAYLPGSDYMGETSIPTTHRAAFGGHVYGQSALVVARTWREMEDEKGAKEDERFDLHVCAILLASNTEPHHCDGVSSLQ